MAVIRSVSLLGSLLTGNHYKLKCLNAAFKLFLHYCVNVWPCASIGIELLAQTVEGPGGSRASTRLYGVVLADSCTCVS